jgi:ectoine hydroxylase-related dioxygenase (phytanoyl-CoA dioxygenase family)
LNTPNEEHHQSAWHRDLPYQSFTSSKPLAFNALICVDPFSEETGGTRFLPSSHLREDFPEIAEVQKNELSINAPAGSIIFFNSMLFHRAGVNVSNATRRAINQMYTLPIIKQQIDLPAALKDNYEQDPFLDRFLGYDSAVAASVIAWRSRRKARKIKANK